MVKRADSILKNGQMVKVLPRRISSTEYDQLLAMQGGVCWLCHKKPGRIRLTRDHDHVTGRLRSLLHARCNRALAPFEWSDEVLTRLVEYVTMILQDRARYADNTKENKNA